MTNQYSIDSCIMTSQGVTRAGNSGLSGHEGKTNQHCYYRRCAAVLCRFLEPVEAKTVTRFFIGLVAPTKTATKVKQLAVLYVLCSSLLYLADNNKINLHSVIYKRVIYSLLLLLVDNSLMQDLEHSMNVVEGSCRFYVLRLKFYFIINFRSKH